MTNDPVTPERLPAGAMERLFELAPDLLGTASLDGYLTCINPAWQKTLGWAQEQLMSEPLRHFLHPDDLDETTRRVTLLREGATSGAITLEHRCATSAGGYRWIEWTVTIDDREYYVIGRDISDRKAAEGERDRATSLTKAIVESVADGIVVADARGQLRHTNPAGARLLGYEPAAPVDRLNIHATRHHSHLDNSPFPAYDCLAHGRLVLYGQPIVSVATGKVFQHELLLRMLSPSGPVVEAGQFLPAAERFGLMDDIDRWVISRALEIAASGRSVAVNLSAGSVGRDDVLVFIERELARTGAKPENVVFEVTETGVINELQDGRRFAERLVALGCAFALDDFGTGYGSFTYLRQLLITYLKIDLQFVREMTHSGADQRLVKTIVSIAQSLGKMTIAEGVEGEDTLHMLSDFGVDFAQGYFLGRPEPLLAAAGAGPLSE